MNGASTMPNVGVRRGVSAPPSNCLVPLTANQQQQGCHSAGPVILSMVDGGGVPPGKILNLLEQDIIIPAGAAGGYTPGVAHSSHPAGSFNVPTNFPMMAVGSAAAPHIGSNGNNMAQVVSSISIGFPAPLEWHPDPAGIQAVVLPTVLPGSYFQQHLPTAAPMMASSPLLFFDSDDFDVFSRTPSLLEGAPSGVVQGPGAHHQTDPAATAALHAAADNGTPPPPAADGEEEDHARFMMDTMTLLGTADNLMDYAWNSGSITK